MNLLNDTALLKHHRVDYGPKVDRDSVGPRRPRSVATWAVLALVPLAVIMTALAV